ncbi:hypothetical protein T484DRAFT_1745752 [Baffinella frigidus]|nr:hypothetical protein T484DRAFT_1745752 [Cryptophyta sp. CCMP2293]
MSVRELKQELEAGGVDTSGMLYKQDLTEAVETMRGERGGVAGGVDTSEEDVTCSICLEVMIEPLRLGCSHAFCRACLIQARRSAPDGGRCGICRAAITIDPETAEPDAEVAAKVAAVLSPKALREREKAAKIVMKTLLSTRVHSLPIFAMNAAVVPGQIISLHMFEPRYALMSRRVQLQRATPSGDGVDIRGKALEIVKLDQVASTLEP